MGRLLFQGYHVRLEILFHFLYLIVRNFQRYPTLHCNQHVFSGQTARNFFQPDFWGETQLAFQPTFAQLQKSFVTTCPWLELLFTCLRVWGSFGFRFRVFGVPHKNLCCAPVFGFQDKTLHLLFRSDNHRPYFGGSFETDPPPKGSGPGKQWCGRVGSWQAMVAEVSRKFPMRWLLLSLIFFVLHNTWWLHNTALNLTWMCDSQFVGTSFHSATFW